MTRPLTYEYRTSLADLGYLALSSSPDIDNVCFHIFLSELFLDGDFEGVTTRWLDALRMACGANRYFKSISFSMTNMHHPTLIDSVVLGIVLQLTEWIQDCRRQNQDSISFTIIGIHTMPLPNDYLYTMDPALRPIGTRTMNLRFCEPLILWTIAQLTDMCSSRVCGYYIRHHPLYYYLL